MDKSDKRALSFIGWTAIFIFGVGFIAGMLTEVYLRGGV